MLGNDGEKKPPSIRAGGVGSILDRGSAERSEEDAGLRAGRARARAPLATRLTSHEGEKLGTLMGGSEGPTGSPSSVFHDFGPWKRRPSRIY